MKKQFFTLLLIIIGPLAFAGSPSAINNLDTVYFDLVNASVTPDYLLLPVFIKSDDVINALDFAMKFDLEKMEYDSLIIHNSAMSPLASYNENDSTLRLTSFSVSAIPNNTTLVTLRFKLLQDVEIKKVDFNPVYALLNGDACTLTITEVSIPTSINAEEAAAINVYPNPTNGILNIEAPNSAEVHLVNMNGQQVLGKSIPAGKKQVIDISGLPNGNYFLSSISNGKQLLNNTTIVKCD